MLKELEKIRLKQDRDAVIYCLEPPDDSPFAAGLKNLYQHKSDNSRRGIFSRLDGKYAGESIDRYFFAVIDGKIAGALWFGYGTQNDAIADFGHVYANPEFRGLGIAPVLLRYFKADFAVSPCPAAFCTSSTEWIAKMYRDVGFTGIVPGTTAGRLMLSNRAGAIDFEDFSASYFRKEGTLAIQPGSMKYRHEADCLGTFSGKFSKRCFVSLWTGDYQQAVFHREDDSGHLLAWCDERDHFFGWCFTAAISPELRCFDFSSHENVTPREEADLVRESLSRFQETRPLLACISLEQNRKREILLSCGFRECGQLPGQLLLLR